MNEVYRILASYAPRLTIVSKSFRPSPCHYEARLRYVYSNLWSETPVLTLLDATVNENVALIHALLELISITSISEDQIEFLIKQVAYLDNVMILKRYLRTFRQRYWQFLSATAECGNETFKYCLLTRKKYPCSDEQLQKIKSSIVERLGVDYFSRWSGGRDCWAQTHTIRPISTTRSWLSTDVYEASNARDVENVLFRVAHASPAAYLHHRSLFRDRKLRKLSPESMPMLYAVFTSGMRADWIRQFAPKLLVSLQFDHTPITYRGILPQTTLKIEYDFTRNPDHMILTVPEEIRVENPDEPGTFITFRAI